MRAGVGALSESSLLRYVSFAALYVAQGLPLGILVVALPAWLASQGLGTAQIGEFVAVATLPWSLKLVWGPLMDRYGFLPMGRRRPWVLGAQAGLALSVLCLAFLGDPAAQLGALAAIGFAISLCSSMQDVAVDGMAIDTLPEGERARANGLMFGGQTLGMAASASAGGMLLSDYGLTVAVLPVGALIILILLLTLSVRERPGERLLPWTEGVVSARAVELQVGNWGEVVRSLFRAFLLPMSLLAVTAIFAFRIGNGILQAFLPVFTVQELGWEDTDYANLRALAGVVSAVVGVLIVGPLVDRFGALRIARITGALAIAVGVAAGLSTNLWSVKAAVTAYMIIESILGLAVFISFGAVFMGMCWQRVAASQFSLYMALANLGMSAGSALTGSLDAVLAHAQIFFAIGACGGAMLLLLSFLNLGSHQRRVEALDG